MALQRKKFTGIWKQITADEEAPARIHVRALSAAEKETVFDATFDINAEVQDYMGKAPVVTAKPQPQLFRAKIVEVRLRVDEWENILDLDSTPLPCTPENVEMIAREEEGFIEMVIETGKEADAIRERQIKAKEKN